MPATASRKDFLKGLAGLWAGLGALAGGAVIGWKDVFSSRRQPAPRRLKPPPHSVKRDG